MQTMTRRQFYSLIILFALLLALGVWHCAGIDPPLSQ